MDVSLPPVRYGSRQVYIRIRFSEPDPGNVKSNPVVF